MITVEEILTVAQTLTFEERKKLIQVLFSQLPKSDRSAGSVEYARDWEAGKAAIRGMVSQSLTRTAAEFGDAADGEK